MDDVDWATPYCYLRKGEGEGEGGREGGRGFRCKIIR